ncbi:TNF receptor-associated factor 3-like isoform X2 [Styela clava]
MVCVIVVRIVVFVFENSIYNDVWMVPVMILLLKVLHMHITPSMPFKSTGPLIEIKTAEVSLLSTRPTCLLLLCCVVKMEPSGSNRITQATNNNDVPPTSSGPPSDEFQQFKGTTEYQIMILQRMVQEVRNSSRVGKEQIETMSKDFDALKTQLKTTETRLAQLQKVVAVQTDNNTKLKRETTEKDNAIKTKVDGLTRDINDLKASVQTITQNLAEIERNRGSSTGGGSSSANIPENLTQMLEALERQLGMYDVRIAEMDLRFQVLETTSYNGCLVWRIRDYERRKEDAKRGRTLSLYSQPFYTSRYGYKMCTRIYLNGDGMGKGTHISLFFVVMKGEYDALLPWPFRQKVTLMLLDQGPDRRHLSDTFRPDPSSSSFKRPTSDMNIASGCPLFVSHTVVDNSTYVKEDTIFLRIVVDTGDLENF